MLFWVLGINVNAIVSNYYILILYKIITYGDKSPFNLCEM